MVACESFQSSQILPNLSSNLFNPEPNEIPVMLVLPKNNAKKVSEHYPDSWEFFLKLRMLVVEDAWELFWFYVSIICLWYYWEFLLLNWTQYDYVNNFAFILEPAKSTVRRFFLLNGLKTTVGGLKPPSPNLDSDLHCGFKRPRICFETYVNIFFLIFFNKNVIFCCIDMRFGVKYFPTEFYKTFAK